MIIIRTSTNISSDLSNTPTIISNTPSTISNTPTIKSNAPSTISSTPTIICNTPSTISNTPTIKSNAPSTISSTPTKISNTPTTISNTPTKISNTPSTISNTPTKISNTQSNISKTPSTTPPVVKLDEVINKNDKGKDVKLVQNLLLLSRYSLGKYGADSDFGTDTENAVKSFQKDHGLNPNGKIDSKTMEMLVKVSYNNDKNKTNSLINNYNKNNVQNKKEEPPEVKLDSVVNKTDKGEDVKLVQKLLLLNGYHLVKYGADSDFGTETENAVKNFQKDHGLNDNGKVDTKTMDMLVKVSYNNNKNETIRLINNYRNNTQEIETNSAKGTGNVYTLSGSSNEEKIWNYLTQYRKLSEIAAAGVMGNMKKESSEFDPFKGEVGGGGGWGLIQWTPAEKIEIAAPKEGMSAGATSGNVDDYLLWELDAMWQRGLNCGGKSFWENMNLETSVGSYTSPPTAQSAGGTQFNGNYKGLGSAYYFHDVVESSGDMNLGLNAKGVPNGSKGGHGNILLRAYYTEQILKKYK